MSEVTDPLAWVQRAEEDYSMIWPNMLPEFVTQVKTQRSMKHAGRLKPQNQFAGLLGRSWDSVEQRTAGKINK